MMKESRDVLGWLCLSEVAEKLTFKEEVELCK